MSKKKMDNVVAQNRKAHYDYEILDTYEAGIALKGTEIKSIRAGRVSLVDGYAGITQNEVFLYNVHIAPFEQGNRFNHDPLRTRKLLLHRQQINEIYRQVQQEGNTLVPLRIYLKNGFAKLLLGLAKGKKRQDKRETIKRREQERDISRALAARNRS
ncbi:SsrA-binding protein SmpB [Allofustis seminis]|uniref:SsrA-binding protein SmpB n=1 Tax=Allofustis seminis TaxID=166939 RepID=UPI00035D4924|nr:SsrA-binding protein SmpB [Allofustis seminis]